MFRTGKSPLFLLLALIAPISSFASHYCIEVGGGFGKGGTTFIGTNFSVPAEGSCAPWVGFTKTASTVVLTTNGAGCLSSDGKVLTVSVSSQDPEFFGGGVLQSDYIRFCLPGVKSCPFSPGADLGYFSGDAAPVTCTSSLEHLPSSHD